MKKKIYEKKIGDKELKNRLITITISYKDYEDIKKLVETGYYFNIAEFIRFAMKHTLEKYKEREDLDKKLELAQTNNTKEI